MQREISKAAGTGAQPGFHHELEFRAAEIGARRRVIDAAEGDRRIVRTARRPRSEAAFFKRGVEPRRL